MEFSASLSGVGHRVANFGIEGSQRARFCSETTVFGVRKYGLKVVGVGYNLLLKRSEAVLLPYKNPRRVGDEWRQEDMLENHGVVEWCERSERDETSLVSQRTRLRPLANPRNHLAPADPLFAFTLFMKLSYTPVAASAPPPIGVIVYGVPEPRPVDPKVVYVFT